jgi:dodecin
MANVVKVIELMSQSPRSWEDAAQGAVKEATKTLRNIRSIYVKEFTAEVDSGKPPTIGSTQRSPLIWSAGNRFARLIVRKVTIRGSSVGPI